MPSVSPSWSRPRSTPASTLAADEKGGVFISPRNQTSGLRSTHILRLYIGYGIKSNRIIPGRLSWI